MIDNAQNDKVCLGVIIPVYNGEMFLKEAICSVLNQECKDLIVVVVNDGSKDNSLSIANQIASSDERVFVLSQENQGVSAARNNGIAFLLEKNVEYIGFLDADDVWCDDFYTNDLKAEILSKNSDACRFSYLEGNEELTFGLLYEVETEEYYGQDIPLYGGYFCSYIYRAEMFSIYSIQFPVGIKLQEDLSLLYLFLTVCQKVNYFKNNMFIYRSNSTSACHSKKDVADAYFNHVIPAWDWVIKSLVIVQDKKTREDRISQCMTMKKTFLCEYIREASRNGESLKEIKKNLNESGLEYLYDDFDIWIDDESLNFWNDFKSKPFKIWMKNKIYGFIFLMIRKILRNNRYFQMKKYPIDLLAYYTKQQLP